MQQLTVTPLYPETSLSAKRFLQLRRMTVQRWIAKALKLPGTPQGLRQAAEYAEGMRRVGVASIDDFGRVSDSTMWHDCPPELRVPKEGGLECARPCIEVAYGHWPVCANGTAGTCTPC